MRSSNRSRIAMQGVGFLGLGTIFVALASNWTATEPLAEVSSSQLETALIRVGLDADSLAAAGVSGPETTEVVADVAAWLGSNPTSLSTADANYAAARSAESALKQTVKSGLASAEEVTSLSTAKSTMATATQARVTVLDAIFDAGTADLSAGQKATLEAIEENRSWKLPTHYLVHEWTQQEWVDLRDALAGEKISEAWGETPDPASQQLIASCDAEQDVAAAAVACSTNLSAVQSAWDAAIAAVEQQ